MKENRYSRNALYIPEHLQKKIKDVRLLFLGVGLSSAAVECCLRTGFENITLIDKDNVEITNLNRQNYTDQNINQSKAESLFDRLMTINPAANVQFHKKQLDEHNIIQFIEKADFVINTLDFDTKMFFKADRVCFDLNKTVISPFNLGYISLCYVITNKCKLLIDECINLDKNIAFEVGRMLLQHLQQNGIDITPIKAHLQAYNDSKLNFIPQLAIGSYLAAGLVTQVLLSLVNEQAVPLFPQPIIYGSYAY